MPPAAADMGAAYGTAKAGVGVASMGVLKPELVMRSIIPVVMAGVIGIYGLIVAVIIYPHPAKPEDYCPQKGFAAFGAGRGSAGRGAKCFLDPPEHLLTSSSIFLPPSTASIRFSWCHLVATYHLYRRFDALDPLALFLPGAGMAVGLSGLA